jgi:hypothetical protein
VVAEGEAVNDFRPVWVGDSLLLIRRDLVVTNLPDGGLVYAKPHDTAEYRDRALALGFRDTAEMTASEAMNESHDFVHLFLSHVLGEPACPVLSAVSREEEWEHAGAREELVLSFQKAMQMDHRSPALLWLELQTGRDTDDLVTEARRVLRGSD